MNNSNQFLVSVCCMSFNHEHYIQSALKSIFKQKTNFMFEIIISDDQSTDKTLEIAKKTCNANLNNKIKIVFLENDKKLGIADNYLNLIMHAQGKYIIFLETDDYWIDNNKLQKQVDFLEEKNEYICCSHLCKVVGVNDNLLNIKYNESNNNEYKIDDYLNGIYPGQTTTLMYRNFVKFNLFEYDILKKGLIPVDRIIIYLLLANGKIFCMQSIMSAYRLNDCNGSSYSALQKKGKIKISFTDYYISILEFSKDNNYPDDEISTIESLLLYCLIHEKKTKTFKQKKYIFLNIKHKKESIIFVIKKGKKYISNKIRKKVS